MVRPISRTKIEPVVGICLHPKLLAVAPVPEYAFRCHPLYAAKPLSVADVAGAIVPPVNCSHVKSFSPLERDASYNCCSVNVDNKPLELLKFTRVSLITRYDSASIGVTDDGIRLAKMMSFSGIDEGWMLDDVSCAVLNCGKPPVVISPY